MVASRPGRAVLALLVLVAFSIVPAAASPDGEAPASAPAVSTSDAATAEALREAVWKTERLLRGRLAAAEAGLAGSAADDLDLLAARLNALRSAARRLDGPAGAELARKVAALRPLLLEAERAGSAAGGSPDSPWRLAGVSSARWVDAADHASCRDALAVGDGRLAANLAGPAGGGELWLRYTPAAGGFAAADTAGSGFDTVIEVYDRCPAAGGTRVARGDDELGLQARAGFRAAAGETRWIRVRGSEGTGGALTVRLEGGVSGIAGIVTRESNGSPVEFRRVVAWDAGGSFTASAETDSDGIYVVVGLTPGTYFVTTDRSFSFDGLLDELYDDLPCPGGPPEGCNPTAGSPVAVPAGDIVTGIDFALGPGGRIAGRVRDSATGAALAEVEVLVLNQNGSPLGEAFTDVAGRYTVSGMGNGTAFAVAGDPFGSGGYQRELYRDIPCPASCEVSTGTPIPVAVGTTTSGIDFDLDPLGAIAGTLTRAVGGAPIPFEQVDVFDDRGFQVSSGFTNVVGEYLAIGLSAGTYFATTETFDSYADELYDDLPCHPFCDPTTGTPIAVALGETTAGIDFALNRLGTISGTLTDAVSGDPIPFGFVQAFDATGEQVAAEFGFGAYQFTGLAAGTYTVVASGDLHLAELYDDLPCTGGPPDGCDPTTGTPIVVSLDAAVTGIDFALTPLGAISGAVTDAVSGDPVINFVVTVWDQDGDFAGQAFFSPSGSYQIGGLETGTYYVTAQHNAYLGELYDDLPCPGGVPAGCSPTTGTPVAVTVGVTTGGIDFALAPKGSISGTVVDGDGQPISGAQVRTFNTVGDNSGNSQTDDDGNYRVGGLDAGSHFVTVSMPGFSGRLYDGLPCPFGGCDPTAGTPVPVTNGAETGGIDFELPQIETGILRGTVTAVTGPLASCSVLLFDGSGNFRDSASTDSMGRYAFNAEVGSWFVLALPFFNHVAEVYDDVPCPDGNCDPTIGTPVPVSAGGVTSGIDFELAAARGILGEVVDGAGNPLVGVAIDLWNAGGALVGTTVTGLSGRYLISPGAGTFFVSTDNGLGAVDEVWDDVQCPLGPAIGGLCDPTTGDPVVVPDFDSLVTGIDFELSGVRIFADGFESGDLSAWPVAVP